MSNPVVPAVTVQADPKKPYKAIVAFFLTILGTLWAALAGHEDELADFSAAQWIAIIVPVILTTGAVYGVRNPTIVDVPPPGSEGPEIPVASPSDEQP